MIVSPDDGIIYPQGEGGGVFSYQNGPFGFRSVSNTFEDHLPRGMQITVSHGNGMFLLEL